MKIIIPTFYQGGVPPKEPKEGDIWYNDGDDPISISVYLGEKWFKCWETKETGYTREQQDKIEQRELEEKNKENKELEKYRKFIKIFKELIKEDWEEGK